MNPIFDDVLTHVEFSTNWNNKTDCDAFTTLRLDSDKWKVGTQVNIFLKKVFKKRCEIKAIRRLYLKELNDFICYLDTGYDRAETIKLLQTMYKNKNINWETQKIAFVLFVTIK